jgi:hypothetical protein
MCPKILCSNNIFITILPNYFSFFSYYSRVFQHIIAGYLRQVWDENHWLYEGQYEFRQGYSCESSHQCARTQQTLLTMESV